MTAKDKSHPALKVKRDGRWLEWSYERYLKEVRQVGRAFIKLGLESRAREGRRRKEGQSLCSRFLVPVLIHIHLQNALLAHMTKE